MAGWSLFKWPFERAWAESLGGGGRDLLGWLRGFWRSKQIRKIKIPDFFFGGGTSPKKRESEFYVPKNSPPSALADRIIIDREDFNL